MRTLPVSSYLDGAVQFFQFNRDSLKASERKTMDASYRCDSSGG